MEFVSFYAQLFYSNIMPVCLTVKEITKNTTNKYLHVYRLLLLHLLFNLLRL